jgi:hypothetical protein
MNDTPNFTPGPWRTDVPRFPNVIYAECDVSRILARVTLEKGAADRDRDYANARRLMPPNHAPAADLPDAAWCVADSPAQRSRGSRLSRGRVPPVSSGRSCGMD